MAITKKATKPKAATKSSSSSGSSSDATNKTKSTTKTTITSIATKSKVKSKSGIISKFNYFLLLLFSFHFIYISNVCPLNSDLNSDDKICEITHNTYNNYLVPTYNDYLVPSYDNYIKPSYYNYIKPSYDNYIVPSYKNYIQPKYDQFIKPKYDKFIKPQVEKLVDNEYLTKVQDKCSPLISKAESYYCILSDKCQEAIPHLIRFKDCSFKCLANSIVYIKENYKCLGNSELYLKFTKTYIYQFTIDLINNIIVRFNQYIEGFHHDKIASKWNKKLETKLDFLKNEAYKYFNKEFTSIDSTTTVASVSTPRQMTTSEKTTPLPTNEKYKFILEKVTKSAITDFNTQIKDIEIAYLAKIQEGLLVEIQAFSAYTHSGYDEIHNLIYAINDDTKEYVSRQEFRDKLKELTERLNDKSDYFAKELKALPVDYSDEILKLRKSVLETLEEFSESTLYEYSKELTATDSDSDSESWNDWKQFKLLKDNILKTRDDILEVDSTPAQLLAKIKELDYTLNIVINDIGSYLAILRAKANLAFQEREKLEKEIALEKEENDRKLAAQEADQEIAEEGEYEDYDCDECDNLEAEPITSSVTRTVTLTVDAKATPEPVVPVDETEVEEEIPEPESTPEVEQETEEEEEEESIVPEPTPVPVVEESTPQSEEVPHHEEIDFQDQIIEEPFEPIKIVIGEHDQMIVFSDDEQ